MAARLRARGADGCATVTALALFVAAGVAVRWLPLPAVARRFGVPLEVDDPGGAEPPRPFDLPVSRAEARRLRAVERVLRRWPPGGGLCLQESLLIGHALRARNPVLRIGTAAVDGQVRFHAWVEVAGTHTGAGSFVALVRGGSGPAVTATP